MLKKSNRMSLEEATRLAILGKLPLKESKEVKTESTSVTTDEDITVIDTDDASIVVAPKDDAVVCTDTEDTLVSEPAEIEVVEEPVVEETPVEETPIEELPAGEEIEESKKITEGEAPLFDKKINETDIKKEEGKDLTMKEKVKFLSKKEETSDTVEEGNLADKFRTVSKKNECAEADKKTINVKLTERKLEEGTTIEVMAEYSAEELDNELWSGAASRWEDYTNDQKEYLMDYFNETKTGDETLTTFNDLVWFDGDDLLRDAGLADDEDEDLEESKKVEKVLNKVNLNKTESKNVEKDIEDKLKAKVAEGLTKFVKEAYSNGKEVKVEKLVKMSEGKLYVSGKLVMEHSERPFNCKLSVVKENKTFRKYTITENKLLKITEGKTSRGKAFNMIIKK